MEPRCLRCGVPLTVEAPYNLVCNTCRDRFWRGFGVRLLSSRREGDRLDE